MSVPKPPKGLFIKTYGCQANVYDSERMRDVLAQWPFEGAFHFRALYTPPSEPHVYLDLPDVGMALPVSPDGAVLYFTDFGANRIRRAALGSLVVTTIAGSGAVGLASVAAVAQILRSRLAVFTSR